ncbi:MAG: bifunctional riboflavin kinase/FAD synthetase [Burkholderiaceae bacterium]|nr:bifunctional riboflavin kinase/FAD synthetase [Burkholderiaceae bacterium]
MEVFRTLPPPDERRDCALTIGNYDGVHRGHQAVIERLRAAAAPTGLPVCVLTFEPHPREYFATLGRGTPPARILTERDKLDALAACGVDRVCIAHFNESFAQLSAEQFVSEIVVDGLRTRHLLIGDDFRFGARRAGDVALLSAFAQSGGYRLEQMETVVEDGQRVSSSAVRDALASGNFDRVTKLLGRPYAISGHVVHGRKLGRQLGFPTLNLRIPFPKPALKGIFVVRVHGLADSPLPAVASLGTRPAVESDGKLLLEVHLFDFAREVYGHLVRVEFLARLRDELDFDGLDALRAQIDTDTRQARAWFEQSGRLTPATAAPVPAAQTEKREKDDG